MHFVFCRLHTAFSSNRTGHSKRVGEFTWDGGLLKVHTPLPQVLASVLLTSLYSSPSFGLRIQRLTAANQGTASTAALLVMVLNLAAP